MQLVYLLFPVLALLLGVVVFLIGSIVAKILPIDVDLPDAYFGLSAQCFGPMLLVLRETGASNFDLVSASFNVERGVWETKLDGDTEYFSDPHKYMSRWQKKPFGIADEKRGVIINPRIARIGELVKEMREGRDFVTDGGEGYQEGIIAVEDDDSHLVDMTAARHIITGSLTATLPNRTETFTELSQSMFDSAPTIQYLVWLGGLGAGAFLVLVGAQLQSATGGGGGGISIGVPMIDLLGAMPI